VQQTEPPFGAFRVTTDPADDLTLDLGSPTMQTERVFTGPPGSDWGGLDPIWSSAYGSIVAFDEDGHRNFVRAGVRAIDVGSLEVTPLARPSVNGAEPPLVRVVVEANEIVNLREDAGRGYEPTVWQLDPLDPGAVVLYFSATTGKLVSALAIEDAAYPTAANPGVAGAMADGISQRVEDGRLVVEGDFSAAFDGEGHSVVPGGAIRVTIGAEGLSSRAGRPVGLSVRAAQPTGSLPCRDCAEPRHLRQQDALRGLTSRLWPNRETIQLPAAA